MSLKVEVRGGVELREIIEKIIFEDEKNGCSIGDLWKRLYEIVPQGQLSSGYIEEILNKLVIERKVKLWFPQIWTESKSENLRFIHTVYFIPR